MKVINLNKHAEAFRVVAGSREMQAATMTLHEGAASDEKPDNEHPQSEQWLYVISGSGTATVIPVEGRRRSVRLQAGVLLMIARRELHQIKTTGKKALRTINFYVPPAYRANGTLRRSTTR